MEPEKRKLDDGDVCCDICKQPCSEKQIDVGIGPYEYWGQRGVDRRIVWASDCCEGDLVEWREYPDDPESTGFYEHVPDPQEEFCP